MTKIASMKVQVSAETSRFDAAMGRIRQQMKGVQQSASMTGAAGFGPVGGRIGAMAGLMGLSGPMLAVAAATAGLATVLNSESQRREQDRARGIENFNEILQSRLSVGEQASLKRVAEMAKPGGSAGDVAAMLNAFRSTEFSQMQKLVQAGMDPAQLSAIASMSDADALKALVDLSRSPNGLEIAQALGGKGGAMFGSMSRIADPRNIDRAMEGATTGLLARTQALAEIKRQDAVAGTDPNQPARGFFSLRSDPAREAFFSGATDPRVERYLAEIANNTRGPG